MHKKVEVVIHLQKSSGRLPSTKKELRSSSIYKKVEVVFHLQENWGRLPFTKKLRSSSIYIKLRSSSIYKTIEVVFHLKLSKPYLKAFVYSWSHIWNYSGWLVVGGGGGGREVGIRLAQSSWSWSLDWAWQLYIVFLFMSYGVSVVPWIHYKWYGIQNKSKILRSVILIIPLPILHVYQDITSLKFDPKYCA